MLNSAAGIIGNLVGGSLFDRIGGYKTIISGVLLSTLSVFLMVFFHSFTFYLILMILLGFGGGMTFPAVYALAGSVWPEGGRKAFNAIYVAQNLGVAVGSAAGGFVASFQFDYIFMANFSTYVIFLGIVYFGFRKINEKSSAASQTNVLQQSSATKNKNRLIALTVLSFGYLLAWMGYVQWQSTIAAYTQEIDITLRQYSLLWTINGALIVLGQPFLAPIIRKWAPGLKAQMVVGLAIFIISFTVAANASQFQGFLAAMIIMTIGEMFVWPAVPTAANKLAPPGREGFYQGIINSTATGGRMFGPLVGGMIVDFYGMSELFYFLIVLYVAAMISSALYDRRIKPASTDSCISATES